MQRRLRGFLASKTHPTPVSRILGQQTLQHQPSGSSASKRQRKSRASLSCKQAAYQDPRQGSVILRQQTPSSVDLQDHHPVLQTSRLSGSSARLCDPPPANVVERRSPGSCASERFSAPASEILGKQTACSAQDPRPASGLQQQLQDPGPANDLQRQPRRSSASKRRAARTARSLGQQNDIQRQPRGSSASKPFSANPQDPRPANDSANPEDPCPANKHERQLLTSPNFQRRVPTKRPSRLRLEVLFVSLLIRSHLRKLILCHRRF